MSDKTKQQILDDLHKLNTAIKRLNDKVDGAVSMSELLTTMTGLLVEIKNLRSRPQNNRWKTIGVFMLGGTSAILFFALVGALVT